MANENNKFLSFSGLETLVNQIYNIFLTKSNAISTYVTKKDFDQFKGNIGDIVNVDTSNLATKQELKDVEDQVKTNKSDIGNCLTKADAEKTYAIKSHTHNYADLKNGVYSAVVEDPKRIFDYITLERPMCRLFIPTGSGSGLLQECIGALMHLAQDDISVYINSAQDPELSTYFQDRRFEAVMGILQRKMVGGAGVFLNTHTMNYYGRINAFIDIEIY